MNNVRHLSKLMVFVSVARKGSFTLAADEMGVTKSAVSQQVSQLERDLGVQLLKRTTRGVSLTALGETLFNRCRLLQDQVNLVFSDISNALEDPKGRFAVTYPYALEAPVILPAMEQLCQEYPGIEPELIASDQTLDLVTHHLDMAIHAGEIPDSSYRALPVGSMTEVFCATPAFLNKTVADKNTIEGHKWIATSWQHEKMKLRHVDGLVLSGTSLNLFAKANTLSSALAMALRNMGMVLLPDVVANPLIKKGELIHMAPHITGPLWPVYSLHGYQSEKPIHVSRFHQLLQHYFN